MTRPRFSAGPGSAGEGAPRMRAANVMMAASRPENTDWAPCSDGQVARTAQWPARTTPGMEAAPPRAAAGSAQVANKRQPARRASGGTLRNPRTAHWHHSAPGGHSARNGHKFKQRRQDWPTAPSPTTPTRPNGHLGPQHSRRAVKVLPYNAGTDYASRPRS